jgi:hypothetical protein
MHIECVIVCKDYSDFLAQTLPENLQQLDRVVVVTHPDDKKTKTLCNHYGVDYVETKVFHEDGDQFNKGRAINLGLSHLRHSDWLLHIDSDILLPHCFRRMLTYGKLNSEFIYGADRQNCLSFENWEKNKQKISPQYKYRYLVTPTSEFPLGSRLVHAEYGYLPIGYFQLWHSSQNRKYPVINGSAEHGDVLFAVQWERTKRALLPEFFVTHLESETKFGINWNGRKSKPFGPYKPHHHHHHHHEHHEHHHHKEKEKK